VAPEVRVPSGHVVTQGTTVSVSFAADNLDEQTVEHPLDAGFDRTKNTHITFESSVHRSPADSCALPSARGTGESLTTGLNRAMRS
jgi:cytochrome P450